MSAKKSKKDFSNNPFRNLKGFSVSPPPRREPPAERQQSTARGADPEEDFASAMAALGVEKIDPDQRSAARPAEPPVADRSAAETVAESASEEEEFMAALGTLDVRFADELPEEDPLPVAGRMKQLRRGQLRIDRSLDLHGLSRTEALEKLGFFLEDAAYQGWKTLRIVTGQGHHSSEGPVVRDAVEDLLRRRRPRNLLEWGRAPRNLGGQGALILFLKS